MPETLLTVDEAAQRLKMNPATLRRQLRAGQIRSVRTGKLWRIPESALEPRNAAISISLPTPDELAALLAPPTPAEIARRLAAFEALISQAPDREADAPALDLSGNRADVYGYTEREDAQR